MFEHLMVCPSSELLKCLCFTLCRSRVSPGQIQHKTVYNQLVLQCCSFGRNAQNFVAKTFHSLHVCTVFSFDLSLWQPLLLSTAAIRCHAQTHNNATQQIVMFPDFIPYIQRVNCARHNFCEETNFQPRSNICDYKMCEQQILMMNLL